MNPVSRTSGGIAVGYYDFLNQFQEICDDHLRRGCAIGFAFIFLEGYRTLAHYVVREDSDGFKTLNEISGNDISIFYLEGRGVTQHNENFNKTFMTALGVVDQAVIPSIVFFRYDDRHISDVSIANISEQVDNPKFVLEEMRREIELVANEWRKQGNFEALNPMPLIGFIKDIQETFGV